MSATASIFLDLNLPNATTWFYFAGLLAVALFFKFSRLLSIRNWDVVTLFLLMPGLLLLIESGRKASGSKVSIIVSAVGQAGGGSNLWQVGWTAETLHQPGHSTRWGYLWLLAASGAFLVRCLIDLILVRRPTLTPNLNLSGLIWLACALFISLVALAARQPRTAGEQNEPKPTALDDGVRKPVAQLVSSHTDGADAVAVSIWVERSLALLCHLSIVVGLVLIGWLHFEDLHAGMAAATFYLLLPYSYLMTPGSGLGRWDHAWPMAWMIWSVLSYRRPLLAGCFLGVAVGSVFFPVLTVPIWLSFYWGRGAGRFALGLVCSAALCLALIFFLGWLNGDLPQSLRSTWNLAHWQPWRAPPDGTYSFWHGIHWAYRMPVFLASLAFALLTLFWPAPKDLAHVLALSAAVLIGLQFWYTDQGGVYILWYLPFLLLLVFRPNLTACQPGPLRDDVLARLGRALYRRLRALLRLPEPASHVA